MTSTSSTTPTGPGRTDTATPPPTPPPNPTSAESAAPGATPPALPEPVVETGRREGRGTRILWPMGEFDVEGFQTCLALTVYHRGAPTYAFLARLGTAIIKRDGPVRQEKLSQLAVRSEVLRRVEARRFSRTRLVEITASCRSEVEARYAAGAIDFNALLGDA